MKGKMSIDWKDVFTDAECGQCNGSGVGIERGDWIDACNGCEGTGKAIDPKMYSLYMDEYNYRMGLD